MLKIFGGGRLLGPLLEHRHGGGDDGEENGANLRHGAH